MKKLLLILLSLLLFACSESDKPRIQEAAKKPNPEDFVVRRAINLDTKITTPLYVKNFRNIYKKGDKVWAIAKPARIEVVDQNWTGPTPPANHAMYEILDD